MHMQISFSTTDNIDSCTENISQLFSNSNGKQRNSFLVVLKLIKMQAF